MDEMFEDPEIRAVFKEEAEERVAHIRQGLDDLENYISPEVIESVFRDAHTIKGSARMLNLKEIEMKAHEMEEYLEAFRRGKGHLKDEDLDNLFRLLSELERMILSGQSAKTAEELLVEELSKPSEAEEEDEQDSQDTPEVETSPMESVVHAPPEPVPETKGKEEVSEKPSVQDKKEEKKQEIPVTHANLAATIKVTKRQLNELMNQAGDLTVTKNRVSTVVDNLEELVAYTQKMVRNFSVAKLSKKPLEEIYASVEDMLGHLEKRLVRVRDVSYEDVYKLNGITSSIVERIKKLGLVPLRKLFDLFPRTIGDLARFLDKEVEFVLEGEEITVDKKIIEEMKDPLMHLLRNAISHGFESPDERERAGKSRTGTLHLKAQQISGTILIEIEDDGRGIDTEKIKNKAIEKKLFTQAQLDSFNEQKLYSILFLPNFSTAAKVSNISGRGVGLDVVKAHVEAMQGNLLVESEKGKGTKFTIELPTTVLTAHVFLVEILGTIYGLPIEAIQSVNLLDIDQIYQIDTQDVFLYENEPVVIVLLSSIIGALPRQPDVQAQKRQTKLHCIVLNVRGKKIGLIVDAIIDEQSVVLVSIDKLLTDLPYIAGATILKNGLVCIIIDPLALIKMTDLWQDSGLADLKAEMKEEPVKKSVLLVDDSYAFRMYCKKMLEEENFDVTTADDGQEAIEKYEEKTFDAIVSDVDMPRMTGIELVKAIRTQKKDLVTPIIILSTIEKEEDKKRGKDIGVSHWITKSSFYQKELLEHLKSLIV